MRGTSDNGRRRATGLCTSDATWVRCSFVVNSPKRSPWTERCPRSLRRPARHFSRVACVSRRPPSLVDVSTRRRPPWPGSDQGRFPHSRADSSHLTRAPPSPASTFSARFGERPASDGACHHDDVGWGPWRRSASHDQISNIFTGEAAGPVGQCFNLIRRSLFEVDVRAAVRRPKGRPPTDAPNVRRRGREGPRVGYRQTCCVVNVVNVATAPAQLPTRGLPLVSNVCVQLVPPLV